eukprot:1539286-Rhodomonas_salina.2
MSGTDPSHRLSGPVNVLSAMNLPFFHASDPAKGPSEASFYVELTLRYKVLSETYLSAPNEKPGDLKLTSRIWYPRVQTALLFALGQSSATISEVPHGTSFGLYALGKRYTGLTWRMAGPGGSLRWTLRSCHLSLTHACNIQHRRLTHACKTQYRCCSTSDSDVGLCAAVQTVRVDSRPWTQTTSGPTSVRTGSKGTNRSAGSSKDAMRSSEDWKEDAIQKGPPLPDRGRPHHYRSLMEGKDVRADVDRSGALKEQSSEAVLESDADEEEGDGVEDGLPSAAGGVVSEVGQRELVSAKEEDVRENKPARRELLLSDDAELESEPADKRASPTDIDALWAGDHGASNHRPDSKRRPEGSEAQDSEQEDAKDGGSSTDKWDRKRPESQKGERESRSVSRPPPPPTSDRK